jgi:hypothetical protein
MILLLSSASLRLQHGRLSSGHPSFWASLLLSPTRWVSLVCAKSITHTQTCVLCCAMQFPSLRETRARPVSAKFLWLFELVCSACCHACLALYVQALPLQGVRSSWWLAELSPWFSAAMCLQTLWCAAFRPWTRTGGLNLQWVPAGLLSLTAIALGGAHGILVQALEDSELSPLSYALAFAPLALHFGWITCASLVNVNGFVAAAMPKNHAAKVSWCRKLSRRCICDPVDTCCLLSRNRRNNDAPACTYQTVIDGHDSRRACAHALVVLATLFCTAGHMCYRVGVCGVCSWSSADIP